MKVSELNGALGAIADQLRKAQSEILAALADAEVPAEAQLKIELLAQVAKALDDIVVDPVVPPPAE